MEPTSNVSDLGLPESREELFQLILVLVKNAIVESKAEQDIPLTEAEAAKIIGNQPQTLASWRANGKGPSFYYAGRYVRYRKKDLDAFIEENMVRTGPAETSKRRS
ncbi:MAG: hypothetical protein ACI8PB_000072 [Desulforhopalus sp.]|jgi:hypothetical protein